MLFSSTTSLLLVLMIPYGCAESASISKNIDRPSKSKTGTEEAQEWHVRLAVKTPMRWPDPVFCTRRYESVSTDSNSSGFPASSTFLSRPTAIANSAGVR